MPLILWLAWFAWTGPTVISYGRHYPGKPLRSWNDGCYVLYQTNRVIAWPMHPTKDVICWQNSVLQLQVAK